MRKQRARLGLYWRPNSAWFSDGCGNYRDLGRLTESAAWEWALSRRVPMIRLRSPLTHENNH